MSNALSLWLEKKYLHYQLEHGRMTISEFARMLGISQSYLTMLLNGDRTAINRSTAYMIAERLADYSLLDILGYDRPMEDIPLSIKSALNNAQHEIASILREKGIAADDPQALVIASEILEQHGLRLIKPSG